MTEPPLRPVTDGVVHVRPPRPGDADLLVRGRDDEFHRWFGAGAAVPAPVGCIEADGEVVGWVDYDTDHQWLEPGEVNVGYYLFADVRRRGYATRAVQLLMHHLATSTDHRVATLLIDPENLPSLAIARRTGFRGAGDLNGQRYFVRDVPPLGYTDGVVSIRRPTECDLERDLEAKDEEQMRWLWSSWQRDAWGAMGADERHDHALRTLRERVALWGAGPKWTFSVDTVDEPYVAYVDCDLANEHVPFGEANISYSAHPAHRGRGYPSRAVRLVVDFLADHTGCRQVHILVDAENTASIRVAAAAGAKEVSRWNNDDHRLMVRHVRDVPRP